MSPLSLRRYRAERMLRREFQGLSERVLAAVASRLAARGVRLGDHDLEECYAQAWQGLYMAVVEGEEVDNPVGWLVTATSRRAIDEHRRRQRWRRDELADPARGGARADGEDGAQRDFASAIDDRVRLRQVFEAFRVGLTPEESQAATLCYLQGMSRSEAAIRMGIGPARMERLMEGRGRGRPGVAAKVGRLFSTIGAELWCEEQASLMRALAFGILAPEGPRYEMAVAHRRECPACRAYVLSLRGLAAALPPVITPLHAGLAAALAVGTGAGATSGASGPTISVATGTGAAQTGTAVAAAASASGASGAAGGGWLLAGGSLGAKVVVGCALALGLGAGCVALGVPPGGGGPRRGDSGAAHSVRRTGYTGSSGEGTVIAPVADLATSVQRGQARMVQTVGGGMGARAGDLGTAISAKSLVVGSAAREFGLEAVHHRSLPGSAQARSATSPIAPTSQPSRTRDEFAWRPAGPPPRATSAGAASVSAASTGATSVSAASAEFSTSSPPVASSPPDARTATATSDTHPTTAAPSAAPPSKKGAAEREFGVVSRSLPPP